MVEYSAKSHAEFVNSLRQLADFYEQNPEVPLPQYPSFNIFASREAEKAREQFRSFGAFQKEFFDNWFVARKTFGSIRLELNAPREQVCRRVVVGTREIPEHIIPASTETIVPAHTEEIAEWQCEPILPAAVGNADPINAEQQVAETVSGAAAPSHINLSKAGSSSEGIQSLPQDEVCEECNHPISAHHHKYGCEIERGDGYRGNSDVTEALGPCGCTAITQEPA
jgi:hypothetical protein